MTRPLGKLANMPIRLSSFLIKVCRSRDAGERHETTEVVDLSATQCEIIVK